MIVQYKEHARLTSLEKTPSFVDGQIAAIARVNGLILVTRNVPDFNYFSALNIQNWHKTLKEACGGGVEVYLVEKSLKTFFCNFYLTFTYPINSHVILAKIRIVFQDITIPDHGSTESLYFVIKIGYIQFCA